MAATSIPGLGPPHGIGLASAHLWQQFTAQIPNSLWLRLQALIYCCFLHRFKCVSIYWTCPQWFGLKDHSVPISLVLYRNRGFNCSHFSSDRFWWRWLQSWLTTAWMEVDLHWATATGLLHLAHAHTSQSVSIDGSKHSFSSSFHPNSHNHPTIRPPPPPSNPLHCTKPPRAFTTVITHHQQPLQSTSPKPLNPKQSSRLFAPLCAFRPLVLLLVGWLLVVSSRHYQNSLPFSTSMGGSGPIMFSPTLLLLIHLSHSNQSDNLQHGFDVFFNQPWLTGAVIWTLRERPLLDLQVRITVHDASGNLKTERNFVLSTNFGEKEHWWKGAAQESKLASALPTNSLLFCSKGYSLSLGTSFQWAVLSHQQQRMLLEGRFVFDSCPSPGCYPPGGRHCHFAFLPFSAPLSLHFPYAFSLPGLRGPLHFFLPQFSIPPFIAHTQAAHTQSWPESNTHNITLLPPSRHGTLAPANLALLCRSC